MRQAASLLVVIALSAGLLAQAQTSASPDVLLKAAMQKEQVDGDLPGALALYKDIVAKFPKDAAAPKALLQMAGIYEGQGDRGAELDVYRELTKRYPDSAASAVARARTSASERPAASLSRTQITAPSQVGEFGTVSPDGRWLSYNDDNQRESTGNLGIWRIGSRDTRLLTNDGDNDESYAVRSIWSRDSRQLAYLWQTGRAQSSGVELRVVFRDGGAPRTLLIDTAETRQQLGLSRNMWLELFDWSPDGDWLLVGIGEWSGPGAAGRARLARVAVSTGEVTTIVQLAERDTPDDATVSPDGAFIAYDYLSSGASSDRDVFVVSADGSSPHTLVADASSVDRVIGWMPDGHLLYTSNGLGTIDVWAVSMQAGQPSGAPFVLQPDVGVFASRGFTADGRLFAEHTQLRTDVFVATIDSATGRFRQTPRPLPRAQQGTRHQATWSPDGTRIAYFHRSPLGAVTLVLQDTISNAVRSYPLSVENPERPVWRPDGRAIAFNAIGRTEPQELFLLDLERETVEPLAPSQQVAFSPDGRYLYYPRGAARNAGSSQAVPSLIRRSLSDGTEDAVYNSRGLAIALVLSPDGQTFAGFQGRSDGAGLSVVVFPAEGGTRRTVVGGLPSLANEVAWSPDGKYLYLATSPRTPDRSDAAIWRVPAAGGTPEKVGRTPWPGWVKQLSVAPDGRLAMSLFGSDGELWSWDNLPALIKARSGR